MKHVAEFKLKERGNFPSDLQDKLIKRMNRIEGQIKGKKIGAQNWFFSPHKDDKELLIFATKVDDKVVSVDGKVPYAELVEIISSLK